MNTKDSELRNFVNEPQLIAFSPVVIIALTEVSGGNVSSKALFPFP